MRQHLALHAATTLTSLTLLACSGPGGELENNEPLADAGDGADTDTGADAGGANGTIITPRFEPDGEGFYRIPWPSDTRVKDDGNVDLRDFPNATSLIIRVFRPELELIQGFSIVPVVYVSLDTSPGNSTMPSPRETVDEQGSVQLIALDEACGERTPLNVDVDAVGDKYIDANTLRASPEPGFVLAPESRYALVVLKEFADDVTFARPAAFDEAMSGEGALAEHYAPLRECLESDGLDPDAIAVASIFTTQDTTSVMRSMRKVVLEDIEAPAVADWQLTTDEALKEFDARTSTRSTTARSRCRSFRPASRPTACQAPAASSSTTQASRRSNARRPSPSRWPSPPASSRALAPSCSSRTAPGRLTSNT